MSENRFHWQQRSWGTEELRSIYVNIRFHFKHIHSFTVHKEHHLERDTDTMQRFDREENSSWGLWDTGLCLLGHFAKIGNQDDESLPSSHFNIKVFKCSKEVKSLINTLHYTAKKISLLIRIFVLFFIENLFKHF